MLPDTVDASYLWDMLDVARAIASFVGGRTYNDYLVPVANTRKSNIYKVVCAFFA
jgi:hypothetical protein